MRKYIEVTFVRAGFHEWPGAKYPVKYLSSNHRHLFHFKCIFEVSNSDREIEFMQIQKKIMQKLDKAFADYPGLALHFGSMSCEHIGEWILEHFPEMHQVEVFEDGENGAIICRG